jgi:beta-galactosidase/beta-glucuronidase
MKNRLEESTNVSFLREEYPRPQFQRDRWMHINGTWDFVFDDENRGLQEKWYERFPEALTIQVPFAYQTRLSGIHDPSFHDVLWYRKKLEIPVLWSGKEIILHFGAVDYRCSVYINGNLVTHHEGGNSSFEILITHELKPCGNELVVRVEDPSTDETIPRGKQYWQEQQKFIYYTRTSGIWQSVWLEPVDYIRLDHVRYQPDIDNGDIAIEYELVVPQGTICEDLAVRTEIRFGEQTLLSDQAGVNGNYLKRTYNLLNRFFDRSNVHGTGWLWTPETPNLFFVTFTLLKAGQVIDRVESYFGMRKISVDNDRIMLNNRPYYMKLVLDQGYFPDGLLTAPTDEDLKKDIELAKQMGFNGARKHQKVEDPRYLYWADQLGFLVWGEMANCAEYSEEAVGRITREWIEVVKRDYNHPSIVVWVPINESWGVSRVGLDGRQQAHITSLYYLTKALDATRLVLSNDGWEHTISDVLTIHNYRSAEEVGLTYRTADSAVNTFPCHRMLYAEGYAYRGEPIILSEYGGIAYKVSVEDGWGYSSVTSVEDYVKAYESFGRALQSSSVLQGFCYTQLTDVEQEINGLLAYDRTPKCSLDSIKRINDQIGGKSLL